MDFRDPSSIPLPTTDDEFERFCLLVARERYGPEFYRYARSGQAQHGIDIYSGYYYKGRCLQCKLHKKKVSDKLLLAELNNELKKAKNKFNDLKQFIFAISVETRPAIQDACKILSNDKIQVIPWFWNQLQEDISQSKWLLRYCLNYAAGAQWISDHFVEQEYSKGDSANWQPLQFYSSNINIQWYGLLRNWDAPREHYAAIRRAVEDSFADTYCGMPVSAVVRGEGGSGKSVLLRRLALDLRNQYTVYWIADNGTDFLDNEWLYDIDNNPNEKYLIVLEDWYRNFASPSDKATANRLLYKTKSKVNVRLLIGDRPAQFTYYPKNDNIIFDLQSDENAKLLSYLTNIVPAWKDKFNYEQNAQLKKLTLFQLIFVYQYAIPGKAMANAENYFLELIQSDYRNLINSEFPFYRGLAYALYIYAHLYTEIGFELSIDSLVVLAESYSSSSRPPLLKKNIRTISDDPVLKKYITIVSYDTFLLGKLERLTFLHDTLADPGWKHVPLNNRGFFYGPALISQLCDILKTKETAYDLAFLLYRVLKKNRTILSIEQIVTYFNFLTAIRCKSVFYVRAIFNEDLTNLTNTQRLEYLQRLIDSENKSFLFWKKILVWMEKWLSDQDRIDILAKIIISGNNCDQVLALFLRSVSQIELNEKIEDYFTVERLLDPVKNGSISVFLERMTHDEKCLNVIRKYLESPEPERGKENFTVCLKLLREEDVAKEAARKYLKSPEPERGKENFTACLKLLREEDVAKEAARKYLKSPEPERGKENFTACLKLLREEDVAKEAARKYLKSPEPERGKENFTACLNVLGGEEANRVACILQSPLEGQDHIVIHCALQIASETEALYPFVEDMVQRIIDAKPTNYDRRYQKEYYIYLQMMKVPLFQIKSWQIEVDRVLKKGLYIHRNLVYSLTRSHINKPDPIGNICLSLIRNWPQEFMRPKKHWGYFTRSLAHPVIIKQPAIKKEICQLCREMLLSSICPSKLKSWLKSIVEKNQFPLWKTNEGDEL